MTIAIFLYGIHITEYFYLYFSSTNNDIVDADPNRSKRVVSYGDNGDAQPISNRTNAINAMQRNTVGASLTQSQPIHGMTPSPLNNSLNNILNYSPPQYPNKNNVTKSTSSIASAINRNSTHSYGSSLLCYQNVSPPSPTSSAGFNTNGGFAAVAEPLTKNDDLKPDGTTTAGTLAGLTVGNTTTLPVAIKKRNKLRHRFSDVGSWGRKKKEKVLKYRSMNIESLEMLGDPVVEDEFFVSKFLLSSSLFSSGHFTYQWCRTPTFPNKSAYRSNM